MPVQPWRSERSAAQEASGTAGFANSRLIGYRRASRVTCRLIEG